jgi:hypothetical protein
MSYQDELSEIVGQMKARDIEFALGLSNAEVSEIEQAGSFQFPPDLRAFLQIGVPIGRREGFLKRLQIDEGFPKWREDPAAIIAHSREWVLNAFLDDIEDNDFWLDEWGARPPNIDDALAIAEPHVAAAPLLIPVFAHRFLPAEPNLPGNPVFSVWQAVDTIYMGDNLQNYLRNEFLPDEGDLGTPEDYREIRFWSRIVS